MMIGKKRRPDYDHIRELEREVIPDSKPEGRNGVYKLPSRFVGAPVRVVHNGELVEIKNEQ